MSEEELIKALEIIKEPITVNCIEYKYFDEENYNKITNVYNNCLWFANNLEQINLTVENLQKENQKYKEVIDKLKEYLIDSIPVQYDISEYSVQKIKDILKEVR